MAHSAEVDIFECENCGNIGFGATSMTCCEQAMDRVTQLPTQPAINLPDLDLLLKDVFGMSQRELEVCLCVMDGEGMTTSEVADQLEIDRSHVSRHLNHLAQLEVLEKRRHLLRQGGHVYVFNPRSIEDIKRSFTLGLYAWMRDAIELVDEISREKVDRIVKLSDEQIVPNSEMTDNPDYQPLYKDDVVSSPE